MIETKFHQNIVFFVALITLVHMAMSDSWPEPLKWPRDSPWSKRIFEQVQPRPQQSLEDLIKASDNFPFNFTITTKTSTLSVNISRSDLEQHINSAYPVLHEQALLLYNSFLDQKSRFGSNIERPFYENTSVLELVDRLLTKRAVAFTGPEDRYLLLDGSRGEGGWQLVGTQDQEAPLLLENSLSYDEIKLAALLAVSSKTFFLKGGQVVGRGVVMGVVGPRLDKPSVMEYREIMKTSQQNTHSNGYGNFFVPTMQGIFSNFYGDVASTYEELQWADAFNSTRYIKVDDDKYFDKQAYTRRVALTIDCLLLEAASRAKAEGRLAALHVVYLGEGVITSTQKDLFVEALVDRIIHLSLILNNLSEICFSFDFTKSGHQQLQLKRTSRKIQLKGGNACGGRDNLKVITYNWNGNALPGNEYWLDNQQGPEETLTTQILELQNPHINHNIQAANLRIASPTKGLLTYTQYLNYQ